jgi:hypothetical protein
MAKKSKRSKPGRRKGGRRVGAFDFKAVPWMSGAQVVGGAVVGTYLVNGPLKTNTAANMIITGGGVALALLAPKFAMLGFGFAAAGVVSALQNANFISGCVPGMGRVVINGGPAGSRPLSQVAGSPRRRMMGSMTSGQQASLATRRAAAGNNRVIIGAQMNRPISSVAGDC